MTRPIRKNPGPSDNRGSGYVLRRVLAAAAAVALVLVGTVVTAAPAAAATRAYGFEGSTGWIGTVTADDGTRSICVNPLGLFPSGSTTYVGLASSIAQETSANNGGHGGTAYTAGAAIQEINYAEGLYVNTTDNVTAAALDLFAYSLIADYPGSVGSSTNLNYYAARAGSSATAVKNTEAAIAATVAANWNRPVASSAANPVIDVDDTTLLGTVTSTVTPVTSTGTLTLAGATQTGTGATVIPINNGQVVNITATPTPEAAVGYTVTATVTWTVPTTPLPELRQYNTSSPRYAQIDMAPAGYATGTLEASATADDPLPNTFSPVVSTVLPAEFFNVGDTINDTVTADVAAGSGPWITDAITGNPLPVIATGTWYSEPAGTPTSTTVPPTATAIGTETLTLNGPGTYQVTGPVAPGPGAYTVVWSINDADQPGLTASFLPTDYTWSDLFAQSTETGSARSTILATTAVSDATTGLNDATSDTVTPVLGTGTTSWPVDLNGDPVQVPFVGTEYWVPGDTAPAEGSTPADDDATVVSTTTLTATSLGDLVAPDSTPEETTDGFYVWQWSTAESDYVDAWTETFAEPSQITQVLAPTMVSSADATVALTDPASDAVTVSGPSMGVAAGLYWLAYLQTAGQPANCDNGATASSVPFSATGTSGGTFRAAAIGGNLVFSSAQQPVEVFGPGTYTPPSPPKFSQTGTYDWVAVLEDLNTGNEIAQGTCGDPAEQTDVVLFDLTSTALSIAASGTSVSDTATVTGPTPTGATIQFAAYKQTAAGDECDTNVVYTGDPMPLTGPGAYKSASTVLPTGRYDWVATTYDRDGNVLQQGTCGDPTEVSTVMPVLATTGVVIAAASLWGALGMVALGGLFVGVWLLLTRRRRRAAQG